MMRLNTRRAALTAFLLTLASGVGLWYFLIHRDAIRWFSRSRVPGVRLAQSFPQNASEPDVRFVPCEMVQRMTGNVNAPKVILRDHPNADATIVAELEKHFYPFEILGATRDFLHVRYPSQETLSRLREQERPHLHTVEGWTRWGEIFPEQSVLVLDAQTGAILTRFPLDYNIVRVIFSPDGRRALFDSSDTVREVLTADYQTARCLSVAPSYSISAVFYQPDGTLYAVTSQVGEPGEFRNRQLNIVRVSDTGGPSQLTDISAVACDFQITRDGRTGFIFYRTDDGYRIYQAAVVDLQTLKIRNTFKVDCDDCPPWFNLNSSGSELYIKPYRSTSVWVIDTRTGQRVRELPYGSGHEYLYAAGVNGDSLYLRRDLSNPSSSQPVLLNNDGRMSVNPLLIESIEAAGARFHINREGTRLYRLDGSGNIQNTFSIERPEVEQNPEVTNYVFAGGLAASPDGQHLFLFIHYSFEAQVIMDCSPFKKPPGKMKH